MTRLLTLTLLSLLFAASGAGAQALGPAANTRGAMGVCKDDLAKLCPGAKDQRAIRRCLDKNEKKLSEPCKEANARLRKAWRHPTKGVAAPARKPSPAKP